MTPTRNPSTSRSVDPLPGPSFRMTGTERELRWKAEGTRSPARPPSRLRRAIARGLLVSTGLALLGVIVVTPLDLRSQTMLALGIFALAAVLDRLRGDLATLALVLTSVAVSARYVFWRLTATISAQWSVDAALGALLLGAELYAFAMLLLGYLQSAGNLPRRPVPLPPDPARWPSIDVFIPTYNEPLEVVRATALAALSMDWPARKLTVYLLDDGRRERFRAFAARAGIGYLVRPDNAHAKAGNLNHALGKTRGEFVAVFDCDHVPTRSFLQVAMGWFLRDAKLAMVQTPHHFYSPDPFERNLRTFRAVPNEGELFYGLIQRGNDLWNAAFFCGSCAVLRRSALEEVGAIAVETVTEDAHTALRLHRRGWRSAYLDAPQAAGLATDSLSAHVGQRIRWARGMAQIFRVDNPLLGRGLSLAQRLCYAGAMLHFFSGIPRLVFLVAPLGYLLFDLHIFNALPLVVLSYGLPHLVHSTLTGSRVHGRHRHSFWSEVYETCLAPYIAIPTTLALLDPKAGTFNVTVKGGRIEAPHFEKRIARPHLVLAALNAAGLVAGLAKLALGHSEVDAIAVNLLWTLRNLIVLAAVLAVAWEQRQIRGSPRVPMQLPAMLRLEGGETVSCRTVDLSLTGGRLALAEGRALARGQRLWVSVFWGGDEAPLPGEVMGQEGRSLRVRFSGLTLEEEVGLVQAIFSRADAWIGWGDGRRRDAPLRALLTIAGRGIAGLAQIVRSWGRSHPVSPGPAELPAACPAQRAEGAPRRVVSQVPLVVVAALALAVPRAVPARTSGAPADSGYAGSRQPGKQAPASTIRFAFPLAVADREATRDTLRFQFSARSDQAAVGATVVLSLAETGGGAARAQRLEVAVNGERVAVLEPDALSHPGARQALAIARKALGDRNLLTLRLLGPEGPCGIVPRGSWRFLDAVAVELETRLIPLPDDLALLPLPFIDRGLDQEASIPIVLAGDSTPSRLLAASLVASWFGVENGSPLEFPVHLGRLPESRAVVFLDGAEAAAALGLPVPAGPSLRMVDHPGHRGSSMKLLVVAGRSPSELTAAAMALATGTVQLAGKEVLVEARPPPAPARPNEAPRWLPLGRALPLSLYPGVGDFVLEGAASGTIALRFRVAPDLWLWPAESVPLDLGYSEPNSAPLSPPRIEVEFNGHHLATLESGALRRARASGLLRLPIPSQHFRGFNELLVHVSRPDRDGCQDRTTPPARVAIAPVVHLEGFGNFASLPDASLFVHDGFPFTRIPDLGETAVVLPARPGPEEIATALSMIAQFASVTGRPALRVTFLAPEALADGRPVDRDLVIIGLSDDNAFLRRWAARLPLALGPGGARVQTPVQASAILDFLAGGPGRADLARAGPLVGSLRRFSAVMGTESPLQPGRSAVFITATSASELPRFSELSGFAESRGRAGDLLVLSEGRRWLFQIGPTYTVGHLGHWSRARWFLSKHWVALLPALVVAVVALAIPARAGLADRTRKRLGAAEGEPP